MNIRRQNGFYSDLAIGISTMVVWQFILNICWVLGFLNADGLPVGIACKTAGIV